MNSYSGAVYHRLDMVVINNLQHNAWSNVISQLLYRNKTEVQFTLHKSIITILGSN